MVNNDFNLIVTSLMKTYTSGEFTITTEMVKEYDPDSFVEVRRDYENNSYHLKLKKFGDSK